MTVKEFSASGRVLFDARLPIDDGSYRAFRFPWRSTPTTRPDLAATRTSPSSVTDAASWNGATDVARWQVLAGPAGGALAPVASTPSTGFETTIPVTGAATTFAVRALAADGHVLATSDQKTAS